MHLSETMLVTRLKKSLLRKIWDFKKWVVFFRGIIRTENKQKKFKKAKKDFYAIKLSYANFSCAQN